MKKKIFSIFLPLAMAITIMPACASNVFNINDTFLLSNKNSISVNEENSNVEASDILRANLMFANNGSKEIQTITADTDGLSGEYTANEHIVINNRIAVLDVATINLEDNSELIIYGGIHVQEGCSLIIKGTGTLIIEDVPYGCAGIGGNANENGGNITIDGGILVVNGGCSGYDSSSNPLFSGAGIGGGCNANCGIVTINGGTVTSNGGNLGMNTDGGAGIGSGSYYYNNLVTINEGKIIINGGTVTANGGGSAAGIGSGGIAPGGEITINGGVITATGGKNGAGIGTGNMIKQIKYNPEIVAAVINITDGIVIAKGGYDGAGIGGGARGNGANVIIENGNVTATGGEDAAGIGGGLGNPDYNTGNGGTVKILNALVTATGGVRAAGIGGGCHGAAGKLTIEGGIVTATGGNNSSGIGKGNSCPSSKAVNDEFTINNEALIAFDVSNSGPAIEIENPVINVPNKIRRVIIRQPATIAVEPVVVPYPLVYNDEIQLGYTSLGENVQIAGIECAKDVGVYSFTAVPVEGCVWSDYTSDSRIYTWSITKAEYAGVTKTISVEINAVRGQSVVIDLPIPETASYGIPQKNEISDPYMLSEIEEGNIIFVLTKSLMKTMTFTVPVIPDGNHYGYNITVSVTAKFNGDEEGGSYNPDNPDHDSGTGDKSTESSNINSDIKIYIYTMIGLMSAITLIALVGVTLTFILKNRKNK